MIEDKINELYDNFYARMEELGFSDEEITDSLVILISRRKVLENYINELIDKLSYIRHKNEKFYFKHLNELANNTIDKMWNILNNRPSEKLSLEEYNKAILKYHKKVLDCAKDFLCLRKLIQYYDLYSLFCEPYYLDEANTFSKTIVDILKKVEL